MGNFGVTSCEPSTHVHPSTLVSVLGCALNFPHINSSLHNKDYMENFGVTCCEV